MAETTEREFPEQWTPDCGWGREEWLDELKKRMAEQSGLTMDERIKIDPSESVVEAGKEAAAQLRRKAAMGIATPVVLAALGIGVSAIATGGIALVPAVIGAVAGGAVGGAATWRTVVGAFGIRGTDPTILTYRMQKVIKNQEQTVSIYEKQLSDMKTLMSQLKPSDPKYKSYEKQYNKIMQNFDKDLKRLERQAGKLNLLANKGVLAYRAHNGPADENSIFGKGVVGKVNSARGRVGGVLDRYTNNYFKKKNFDVTKMYQGAVNLGESSLNMFDDIRKKYGLIESEVTKESREQTKLLDSKSAFDAMSEINKKTYNKKGLINTIEQTDAGKNKNYANQVTKDIKKEQKRERTLEKYENLSNVDDMATVINEITNDKSLNEQDKIDLKVKLLSDGNNSLKYNKGKNFNGSENKEVFNMFIDLAKSMKITNNFKNKYERQGFYSIAKLVGVYDDFDFGTKWTQYIKDLNLSAQEQKNVLNFVNAIDNFKEQFDVAKINQAAAKDATKVQEDQEEKQTSQVKKIEKEFEKGA